MGARKGGTNSGGFFHLFDLSRKSRKKLFSNGAVSPESSKHEKRSDNSLPSTHLRLDDDDEIVGVSSAKGSSDYSCASSVTDEGYTSRPPGVVARLMGLDSMPMSGASEPSSTPFFDSRFLHEKHSQKRSPDFCINNQFNNISHRTESYARKPMELRSQRMPSSPIERFQTETIPPRLGKTLPLDHQKLFSPIKNPCFISGKNAAHIMEAAAKILDPGLQHSMRSKVSSFGSPSIPLKVHDSRENMMAVQSQRKTRILESVRTPAESTDVRYLRGQSMNRCWNGLEDSSIYRRSPDFADASSADAKNKGKSISLAIQAKVNVQRRVQRRDGLSSSGRNTPVQKNLEEFKVNQSFRSQPNHQKNKQQRKLATTTNSSGVLRQNNQKQNCLSNKHKQSPKQLVTNQHGRKVISGGDATYVISKTVNKLSGKSRFGQRKEGSNSETDGLSSTNKDFPQKKRLIERGFFSEKDGYLNNFTGDRHQKHVQPNVVIDEHSYLRWDEDNRSNGADVVSFTFTSPLVKPTPRTASSIQVVQKWDKRNVISCETHNKKNDSDVKDKKVSSQGLNVITADALSVLLEQKLRELTSGVGTSNCSFLAADSFTASSSVTQELLSDFDAYSTSTTEIERKLMHKPCRENLAGAFHPGVSSTNGLVFGLNKPQRMEEVDCSSNIDAQKEPDFQNLSPLSTFESSFSAGSFISTDSAGSIKGSKVCSSSIQAKSIMSLNSVNKDPSPEVEVELSDSASSVLTETSDACELTRSRRRTDNDLDYVRKISSLWSLVSSETVDPLVFDKLEDEMTKGDKDGKMRRKLLFDCVNECLDLKCSRYFRAGYNSWSKGVGLVGNNLAEELYEEILGWKRMGDWMVDELVDMDMSTHRGRWVDFETEAFVAGREIENEIVSSLVDEIVADCLIRRP